MSQYILTTDVLTAPLFVSGDRNLTVAVLMCSSDMNDHALKNLPGCVHRIIQSMSFLKVKLTGRYYKVKSGDGD